MVRRSLSTPPIAVDQLAHSGTVFESNVIVSNDGIKEPHRFRIAVFDDIQKPADMPGTEEDRRKEGEGSAKFIFERLADHKDAQTGQKRAHYRKYFSYGICRSPLIVLTPGPAF